MLKIVKTISSPIPDIVSQVLLTPNGSIREERVNHTIYKLQYKKSTVLFCIIVLYDKLHYI